MSHSRATAMRYYHTCPYCESEITVAAAQVGKRAECSECGAGFNVPTKVRDNPVPEAEARPARKFRSRREDPDASRRAGMMLGLLVGLLGLLATGVVVACLFAFTNVFTKDREDTARVEQPEPEPKPQPKTDPKKTDPKPEPKQEPKVTPTPPTEPGGSGVSNPPKADPPGLELPPVRKSPPDPEPEPDFPPPRPPVGGVPPRPPVFNPPPFNPPPPPVFNPPPPVFDPPPFRPDRPAEEAPKGKLTFPAATPVELKPAPLAGNTAEVKLPDKVADAVVGGGGRYWCLLLPDAKQVAVFDANQGKVAKYIPLASGKACIAAGMNKLLVVYPDTEVIVRYDLGTFEKEVTAKLPFRGTVKQTCLGAASAGPMLVFYGKGTGALDSAPVTFLDITTLKEVDAGGPEGRGGRALTASFRDAMHYRASPDGKVYGAWATSHSPTGLNGIVLSEAGVKSYYEHDSVGGVVPAGDGKLLTGAGIFTPELKAVGKKEWSGGQRIPAQQGDWYLSVAPAKGNDFGGFPDRNQSVAGKTTIYRTTDTRPILSLGDIGMTVGNDAWTGVDFTQDKRVLFSPVGGLIAWVAPTNDKIHLYKFNLDAELEKSGVDYLFVTSRPPAAEPGKPYSYKVAVKSKQGAPTFKLDAGPAGMKVAADGTVTWAVPKDYAGDESIILTISDKSGQEVFHTFTLAKGTTAAAAPPGGGGPVVVKPPEPKPKLDLEPRPDPVPPRPDLPPRADPNRGGPVRAAADPAKITPTKAADRAEIKLPGAADLTCLGGGGRYVLFRIPKVKQVAILDVCEGKIAKYLPLAEDGALIAAGNEHLFVLNPGANVVQRWSLKTFQKEATVPNPLTGTPRGLLVGHATDGPVFVVGPNKALNAKTFKEVELGRGANGRGMAGHPQYAPNVRVSADGRVFAWWTQGLSPSGLSSMVVGGDEAKGYSQHTTVGAIIPGPDGTLFTAGGVYTPELKRVGGNASYQYWYHAPIPAAHGNLYLDIPPNDLPGDRGGAKMFVKMLGEAKPLGEVTQLAGLDIPKDHNQTGARGLQLHDRVFLVPDAKALVVLNGAADKVIIHKFDPEALMEKAGIDYLFVVSRPPAAVPGTAFSYKPEVKSRKGGVKVTLDAGPAGMKVAADGTVTWAVPKDYAGDESIILTISDKSGQEVFHTFTLPAAGARP